MYVAEGADECGHFLLFGGLKTGNRWVWANRQNHLAKAQFRALLFHDFSFLEF
jgi:hypothetical protein